MPSIFHTNTNAKYANVFMVQMPEGIIGFVHYVPMKESLKGEKRNESSHIFENKHH